MRRLVHRRHRFWRKRSGRLARRSGGRRDRKIFANVRQFETHSRIYRKQQEKQIKIILVYYFRPINACTTAREETRTALNNNYNKRTVKCLITKDTNLYFIFLNIDAEIFSKCRSLGKCSNF